VLVDPMEQRNENVTVAVRLRPPATLAEDITETYTATQTGVIIRDPLSRGRQEHHFDFSRVFLPEHGQDKVFEFVAKPLIDHLLKGFNSCCFAYGQTGSGKTHSVFGEGNADQRGMLARSIEYLFEKIESLAVNNEVGMAVSFTEVYLDQVRDLGRFYAERHGLGAQSRRAPPSPSGATDGVGVADEATPSAPSKSRMSVGRKRFSDADSSDAYLSQDLEIHESAHGHVYVEDLCLIPVSNIREVLEVANLGVKMRATYETKLNARSSRSHTVFTVSIAQRARVSKQGSGNILASSVNFVDLAGSERLAHSQSEGRRFQEAVVINTSLSALGKVVLALGSNHRSHVPYRDSKLTRILQNSLGGNSFTTLLTTIDPSAHNFEESLNSLFFADRCKNVQNRPIFSYAPDDGEVASQKAVASLAAEVDQLRRTLEAGSTAVMLGGVSSSKHNSLAAMEGYRVADVISAGPAASDEAAGADANASGAGSLRERWRKSSALGTFQLGRQSDGAAAPGAWKPKDAKETKQLELLRQAQERLHQDVLNTQELQEKVEAAEENMDQAWQEFYDRDFERRQKAVGTRRLIHELEREITQQELYHAHAESTLIAELNAELVACRDSSIEVVRSRERQYKGLAKEFTEDPRDAFVAAALEQRLEQCVEAEHARTLREMRAVEEGLNSDDFWVDTVQRQRFQEEEAEGARFAADLASAREGGRQGSQENQGDLISAFDLLSQLRTLLGELRAGIPASQLRSSVRPPRWLVEELQAELQAEGALSKDTLETLHSGISELRRQLTKFRRGLVSECPPQQATTPGPALSSARSAASDSAAATAVAVVAEAAAGAGDTGDAWDAEEFAWEFCGCSSPWADGCASSEHGDASEPCLQHLGVERLRSLGLALWRRACMGAAVREVERSRLRQEVSKELSDHSRVHHICQLEKDIAGYEVRLRAEEEKNRQLSVALKFCLGSGDTCGAISTGLGSSWGRGGCSSSKAAGSGARAALAAKAAVGHTGTECSLGGGGLHRRPASAGARARHTLS